ncbi:MAG: hypothetical protein E7554_08480 [Ruminococcaceae bacterium]|nr:hypothetical protein [Oscillospiraceae bacterium]
MAIDDGRLKAVIGNLKGTGISLTDIEKEINLRNKWGKRQHPGMTDMTTEDLKSAMQNWMRF